VIRLLKGFAGKPFHPPLTDASIGAYTVGVAMLVLGALGVEEEQMAHGSLLAISGLLLALPTALTGFLDWLDTSKGTPLRTTATVHMLTMIAATARQIVDRSGMRGGAPRPIHLRCFSRDGRRAR
jgi:uncharacterized membrane protein